jgi:hypothetical protein
MLYLPLFHLDSTSISSFVPFFLVNLSKNANGVAAVKNVSFRLEVEGANKSLN